MTMSYRILVGDSLKDKEYDRVQKIIRDTFQQIDMTFNKWNPQSELTRLNQVAAHVKTPLSAHLEQFLILVDEHVHQSGGRFDPTIEPLQSLWRPLLHQNREPTKEMIKPLLPAIGWENIHFERGLFWKDYPETALDLGGVAKGYGIDLLIESLAGEGYVNLYVEWGGEIRTLGQHPSKRPWRVSIRHPSSPDSTQAVDHVNLHNEAIATSGDYLQRWTISAENGSTKTYTHIFDPTSGYPLECRHNPFTSVTVVAPTCLEADALATTAMLFSSHDEAKQWATVLNTQHPQIRFWFIDNN